MKIEQILSSYCTSFRAKAYNRENDDSDLLMDIFGITPNKKRENRQYWGRELGMMWQKIIICLAQEYAPNRYAQAFHSGNDEPCDLIIGEYAIDTKYRIGSGDSGTLKKFKQYAELLNSMGY